MHSNEATYEATSGTNTIVCRNGNVKTGLGCPQALQLVQTKRPSGLCPGKTQPPAVERWPCEICAQSRLPSNTLWLQICKPTLDKQRVWQCQLTFGSTMLCADPACNIQPKGSNEGWTSQPTRYLWISSELFAEPRANGDIVLANSSAVVYNPKIIPIESPDNRYTIQR